MQTEQTFQSTFTWSLPKRPSIYGQFSPLLMDSKITLHLNQGLDSEQSIRFIGQYKSLIEGILQLGELEHTGDWDPYLSIKLHQGIELATAPGYSEIELDGNTGITPKSKNPSIKTTISLTEAYLNGLISREIYENCYDVLPEDPETTEIIGIRKIQLADSGIHVIEEEEYTTDVITIVIPIKNISSITLEE